MTDDCANSLRHTYHFMTSADVSKMMTNKKYIATECKEILHTFLSTKISTVQEIDVTDEVHVKICKWYTLTKSPHSQTNL